MSFIQCNVTSWEAENSWSFDASGEMPAWFAPYAPEKSFWFWETDFTQSQVPRQVIEILHQLVPLSPTSTLIPIFIWILGFSPYASIGWPPLYLTLQSLSLLSQKAKDRIMFTYLGIAMLTQVTIKSQTPWCMPVILRVWGQENQEFMSRLG